MIALDTNVLLRVIVEDDAAQLARVRAFFSTHQPLEGESPRIHVPPLVICEVVWVLDSVYRRPKQVLLGVLDGLLASRDIDIGDRGGIQGATRRFREGKGEFSDYYICESALRAGCESVATFERVLVREQGFVPL
jgi:predicted nucleic-acid-binding protein